MNKAASLFDPTVRLDELGSAFFETVPVRHDKMASNHTEGLRGHCRMLLTRDCEYLLGQVANLRSESSFAQCLFTHAEPVSLVGLCLN